MSIVKRQQIRFPELAGLVVVVTYATWLTKMGDHVLNTEGEAGSFYSSIHHKDNFTGNPISSDYWLQVASQLI